MWQVDKLLDTTAENPRHRFLLQAFGRHRYLEVAGRREEICAPDMMITDPVFRFHYTGLEFELRGQDQVKGLYRMWAETNQIFFPIYEEVAVADHFVASVATAYQQVLGKGQEAGEVSVLSSKRCCQQVDAKGRSARVSTTLTVAICSFTRQTES